MDAIDTCEDLVLERARNRGSVFPLEHVQASYELSDRRIDVHRCGLDPYWPEQVVVELGQVL